MNTNITRKSQELAFALLRVSSHIRRAEMRKTLERLSYHLLENVSYGNAGASLMTIEAIRNFVVLGKNIYEIETVNAKILDRELEQLRNSVNAFCGLGELPDLESMFTKSLPVRREQASVKTNQETETGNKETGNQETGNQEEGNTEIRQEKIIALIRTSMDRQVHLKEISSAFPEVSERTIRNDLKKLVDDGRIVRQGSGGPSNYYTLNQALALPSLPAHPQV